MKIGLDKIIERIYSEDDLSRNLSVSGGGVVALVVYLIYRDAILAALSLVITFPLFRVIVGSLEKSYRTKKAALHTSMEYREQFERLSWNEREIVAKFLINGASVLPPRFVNSSELNDAGVRSLINRGILRDDIEDGLVMDHEFFSMAVKYIDINGELRKTEP